MAVVTPQPVAAEGSEEACEVLRQNGIASDTPSVIEFLRGLQADPGRQARISVLIHDLSADEFVRRETAAAKLATCGEAARQLLSEAAKSDDLELRSRAIMLLRKLDAGDSLQRRQSMIIAALEVLQSRRDPQAVSVLVATLDLLDEPLALGVAAEALWACADASHLDLLFSALDHDDVHVRAAATVALEIAGGEQAVDHITPLLESPDERIRLAAARALIDRQSRDAVRALLEVVGGEDQELVWQADALLRMKTGQEVEPSEDKSLGDAWNQWARTNLANARLETRVGAKRLDLSAGRNVLEEFFALDSASLAEGYGRFLYEADNAGAAKVAAGKLRIDGDNPEGDQRLFITSQRMIGRDSWPRELEIRAKMAGEAGNNFGWHLGVSVGRVKTLFHPGLGSGGFRAETTDEHEYLFGNEDMSFDPVTDVFHEMIVRVTKTGDGAEFDITVKGGRGGEPHRKNFSVTSEQLGDFDRIGLERSGRTGGDALFDSISIRLGSNK